MFKAQPFINLKDHIMYVKQPHSALFTRVLISSIFATGFSGALAAPSDRTPAPTTRNGSVTHEITSRVFVGTRDSRGETWCFREQRNDGRNSDTMKSIVQANVGEGVRYWNFRYTTMCKYSRKDDNKTRVQLIGTATYSYAR